MACVLSTRPREDALIDAEVLARSGIDCLPAPMMRIVPLNIDIDVLFDDIDADAVALTSRHAVSFIAGTRWAEKPVFCVGESTARLAREAGMTDVTAGDGDGQGLVELISTTSCKSIFWPSAVDVGFDLDQPLADHNVRLHRHSVYKAEKTHELPDAVINALAQGDVSAVLVHSGRAGAHLVDVLGQNNLSYVQSNIDIVSVSARVAGHCGDGWRNIIVAQKPRRKAMFDAIIKIMNTHQKNDL